MYPAVEGWHWDEENIEHLARHSVTPEIVLEVAGGLPLFRENLRGRATSHQMVGPDNKGETWVICIREVELPAGIWRAVTGWRGTQKTSTGMQGEADEQA